MNIAVITGASSGLGVEFYKEMQKEGLDEIWIMARREGKLSEVSEKYGKIKTRVVAMDITARENIEKYSLLLKEENPNIKFLINNAGFGTIGNLDKDSIVCSECENDCLFRKQSLRFELYKIVEIRA